MNEPGLPSLLGIKLDHTIDYLARYREVVARELRGKEQWEYY